MLFNANLTNCDLEPIHIPGKIQHHGFLIVANKSYQVTCCSENIKDFLPVTAGTVLGKSLETLEQYFNPSPSPDFFKLILVAASDKIESFNPYPLSIQDINYNLIVSNTNNQYLLDFEPIVAAAETNDTETCGDPDADKATQDTMESLLQGAAKEIKDIIGFDRVMIYKFHADGHGEVVAEEKLPVLQSLLGLHYPASDIPQQARVLYMVNHVRLIADVNAEPSAILGDEELIQLPLDLTFSALRAVSPIHIQYLKNMGVASSFSVSIVCKGELWGLVACHNYSARFINYNQRESAKMVGQALALAIISRQNEEKLSSQNSFDENIGILAKGLLKNELTAKTLADNPVTLLNIMDATGVALHYNQQWFSQGNTPSVAFLTKMTDWLAENMEMQVYETNQFPVAYPAAAGEKDWATGILVCTLSKELKEYMIWFRPEIIKTVSWAGNPEKPNTIAENGLLTIEPRQSFETWKEVVELTAQEWTWEDLQRAIQVRDQIVLAK